MSSLPVCREVIALQFLKRRSRDTAIASCSGTEPNLGHARSWEQWADGRFEDASLETARERTVRDAAASGSLSLPDLIRLVIRRR